MPLVVPCPHCQRRVQFPESDAGRVVLCPECQTPFETPPAALPIDDADEPVRRVSTTGIPLSAWQALTDNSPLAEDEPPSGRGPFRVPAPRRADWEVIAPTSGGRPPLEAGWGRVSSGLGFIGVLTLAALGVSYLSTCMGLLAGEGAGIAGLLMGGVSLVGMLLYLLAMSDVCAIPKQSGVRGLTHASAWITLAGFVALGLGLLLVLLSTLSTPSYTYNTYGRGTRSDPFLYAAVSVLVFLLAAVLLLLGYALFVFAVRGMAVFFGDHKLAQNILIFFFCSIAIPFAAFIILICLISAMNYRDTDRVGAMVSLFVLLVVNTILSLWYFNLLRDVRFRIDSARSHNESVPVSVEGHS